MKKKIFGALVVAIAVGAMTNVNLNKVSNKGDLALANLEALAHGENIGDCKWILTYVNQYNYNCHDYGKGDMCCYF